MKKLVGLDRYLIIDCEDTFFVFTRGVAVPFNPGRYLIDTKEYGADLDIYIDDKVMMYSIPFFPSPIRVYESVSKMSLGMAVNAVMAQNEIKIDNLINTIVDNPLRQDYRYLQFVGNQTTVRQVIDFVGLESWNLGAHNGYLSYEFPVDLPLPDIKSNISVFANENVGIRILSGGNYLECFDSQTGQNISHGVTLSFIRSTYDNYTISINFKAYEERVFEALPYTILASFYTTTFDLNKDNLRVNFKYDNVFGGCAGTNVDAFIIYKPK
jgi:hypothetical protein